VGFCKVFHSGSLLVLPTNIRLGWQSIKVANTLAYYDTAIITAVKSFIVQAPGVNVTKKYFCQKLSKLKIVP
jgi:hypothetical protein